MAPDLPAGDPSDVAAGDPSDVALKSRDPNAAEQPAPRERAKQLHVEAQRRYLERKRQRGPAFAACWQQLSAKEQKACRGVWLRCCHLGRSPDGRCVEGASSAKHGTAWSAAMIAAMKISRAHAE
jgi:hypothetical protein